MISVALALTGLALVLLPAAWWSGLFVDAGRAVARSTSTAFVAALPVLGVGLLAFGLGTAWGPAPAVGFGLLVAFVVVLFAGSTGRTERLAPPSLRPQALRRRPLSAVPGPGRERRADRPEGGEERRRLAPGA
jgi:hypothetical protein